MPDREKVINALDCCLDVIRSRQFSSGCGFCPYMDTEHCKEKMIEDAIALLKGQREVELCDRCGRYRLESGRRHT